MVSTASVMRWIAPRPRLRVLGEDPDAFLAHALADDIERHLVIGKAAAGDT